MPCLLVLDNAPTATVRHKTLCDALQKMLGTAVGVAYDANGKPSLTGYPPLRYLSVTTTGDYMVAALAVPLADKSDYLFAVAGGKT